MTTVPNANQSAAAPAVISRSQVPTYDISQSKDALELAKDLARFIKENRLTTTVQGKEFVNVEGWQYAGSRLGIVPIVEHILSRSTELELKYEAKVSLFDLRHQVTVGQGFAVCSNKESNKKFWQEYAVLSMAQTRAIGKAYRNILAWIIRAAGYEPTPAEEMDQVVVVTSPAQPAGGVTGGPAQVTVMAVASTPAPAAVEEVVEAPVVRLDSTQREQIVALLNHPKIERSEKTKVLLNYLNYSPERAEARIKHLVGLIESRTGKYVAAESPYFKYTSAPAPVPPTPTPTPAPALTKQPRTNSIRAKAEGNLRAFVEQNAARLGRPEVDRLLTICGNSRFSPADIQEELKAATEWLSEASAA
jgi:hypothetical protein